MKKVIRDSELKLQPLRLPGGWIVRYNQLWDICPTRADEFEIVGKGGRDPWLLFGQNLLHLQDTREGRVVLDLGWYPDSDPSGQFDVRLVLDEDWDHSHMAVNARTLAEAVDAIEVLAIRGLGIASQLRRVQRLALEPTQNFQRNCEVFATKQVEVANIDSQTTIRRALSEKKVLIKARYIDELARRAIESPELLASACAAITNERMLEPRMGPALGWLGATRILESRDRTATAGLLQAMNEWSADEQGDLIRAWAGNARVDAAVKELHDLYGWSPKF